MRTCRNSESVGERHGQATSSAALTFARSETSIIALDDCDTRRATFIICWIDSSACVSLCITLCIVLGVMPLGGYAPNKAAFAADALVQKRFCNFALCAAMYGFAKQQLNATSVHKYRFSRDKSYSQSVAVWASGACSIEGGIMIRILGQSSQTPGWRHC